MGGGLTTSGGGDLRGISDGDVARGGMDGDVIRGGAEVVIGGGNAAAFGTAFWFKGGGMGELWIRAGTGEEMGGGMADMSGAGIVALAEGRIGEAIRVGGGTALDPDADRLAQEVGDDGGGF